MKVALCVLTMCSVALAFDCDLKRNEVKVTSLQDFQKCSDELGDPDVCLAGLERYIAKHPKEAFEAGKKARINMKAWAALPYFEKAIGAKPTPAQCKDEDVALSILSGLGLAATDPFHASAGRQ